MKKILGILIMTLLIATASHSVIGNFTIKNTTSSFAEVLDQSQTWEDDCFYIYGNEWQQFIPTLGNLNRIELKVGQFYGGSPDLIVSVESPLGNVLTSMTMSPSNLPSNTCDWISFNLPDISLTPGDDYRIRVTAPPGSEYAWGIAYNNLYLPGVSSQFPADFCFKTYGYTFPKIPGLIFSYMDFMLIEEGSSASGWGHLEVDIDVLTSHFQLDEGYLNVYSDDGWVIANMFINQVEGMDTLSTYFRLMGIRGGPGTKDTFTAHVDFNAEPVSSFGDGDRTEYELYTVYYLAEGVSSERRLEVSFPPEVWEYIPYESTWDFTKPLGFRENVQCAFMQCVPMAVANSLQYLENNYPSITIPHNHVMGFLGDNSLVGKLDTAMGRVAASRTDPAAGGCNFPMMFDGKFKYLKDNGLENKLVHKFQGIGHWGITTPGDYTSSGITAKDESVGGKVTFQWIEQQLRDCEDVEIAIKWGGGGGHMVRIFGCGRTNGKPYLRAVNDANQFNDAAGLETPQVYVEDLDGDGWPNWGSIHDEIVFAMSESPKPLGPFPPAIPFGSSIINAGEEETYVTVTTDPAEKLIEYFWDWDDGTLSQWEGPYESGQMAESTHVWTEEGYYNIKVKARNTDGIESEWSDPFPIEVPKSKTIYTSLFRYLKNYPILYQLLRVLQK
jgi:hypothetical protein